MITLCKAEGVPSAQLELHSTFPMRGDLLPNPNWARLPLFDRKDWTRVRFGDVVQNVNETERSPAEAGIEWFIGMEHLEPGVAARPRLGRCGRWNNIHPSLPTWADPGGWGPGKERA
jgi:hypothetical protein